MPRTHTQRYLTAILNGASGSASASRRTSGGSHPAPDSDQSSVSDDESVSIASKSSLSTDEMQNRILETLEDASLAEEDKPDQLKELLANYVQPEPGMDLDALVLGLLHRHREDLNPTGATFPLPQTPTKSSSLSRSSSYRRGLVAAPGLSRRASGLSLNAPPSRPHSPSPLSGLKLNPHDMVNHSPNRHLSVAASEFRPGATSAAASVASPGGTITSPGPANWSFNGSPLGTPRFQNSTMAAAQTSYFPSVPSPSLATSSTKDIWADQQGAASSNYSPHQEPDAHLDEPPDVFQHVSDWQKQQQQIDMNGHNNNDPGGLNGASGLYTMTPLDVLCSIFADSGVASAEMEAALELHAWDLDKAIEHIIASHHGAGPPHQGHPMIQQPQPLHPSQTGMPDPEELARGINSIVLPGAAPRQPTFGRAGVLARNDGFPSPRGSQPSSPRWGSRPITPTPGVGGPGAGGAPLAPYTPSAASNRVCRYYLQGSCLRSDCRYNHDISKAVCRFWLRGHCLKGPDRCDFMHMIPPHLAQDVAAMKMRMDQERRERREREREMERDDMHSQEEDFPSLGAANTKGGRRDPAANRWASAVKSSKSVPSAALQSLMNEHGPPGVGADVTLPGARVSTGGGERQSPRITLRPPVLLPTLSTGSKMSESYANYRNKFLELGASRARCLSKAAECWKRGDGAGARMWSREAQSQDLERLAAGREASAQIVEERKKLLREAVMQDMSREGRVDLVADRSAKGKEAGGRLGTVLGVISRDSSSQLSPEERTEVAVDLHGLHAEEATDILFRFLSGLERESFLGIAYCVVGQEKHSIQGQVKTRLNEAVSDFLDQYKYPYLTFGGIFAVDPREHI